MPFQNLSGPREVVNLNAEVHAFALLQSPGLLAALSSDPVRIAVQPLSGGSRGKTTQISLDGAAEVALLSRDVAVIRSSDDAIWALLDITHTPKTDQVARDMRALCMRPTGESALALGWDGSATQLTLNRHEVEARSFPLRGNVRACDLTDSEVYAVVDGEGGGQLRVHPGATPEPGPSVRAALPREAASFDRVRGGARLAAIYKRGAQTVCLMTGGPNRLTAKLVQLESAPADVAVLETSLFAVYPDGRAALYDADAIAGASDAGPIKAKATIALGARGEPRTVAIHGKGAPVLWVGTSTGEVVSVSVIRKPST